MATVNYSTRVEDGTKTAPSYSFRQDTDTGLYRIGANNVGISCGDTLIVDVATTGVAITGTLSASNVITLPNGTAVAPSLAFTASTGLGFYRRADNILGVCAGGGVAVFEVAVDKIRFGANMPLQWSSNADPSLAIADVSFSRTGAAALGLTGALNVSGNFSVATSKFTVAAATGATVAAGAITTTSATAGIGYGTGAGGAVEQITNRTTGVTLNKICGAITLVSAAGSATPASFTVTNSAVAATDVIRLSQKSGTDKYVLLVTAVAAGSFEITAYTTGGTTTEQPVINFAVMKAVAA